MSKTVFVQLLDFGPTKTEPAAIERAPQFIGRPHTFLRAAEGRK
jgi:hypothetical protein